MSRSRLAVALGLVALVVGNGGCSFSLDRSALVPTAYDLKARHKGAVSILVAGGKEPNMWTEGVVLSNDEFSTALREAIAKSALFSSVAESGAPFRLEVILQRFSRPGAGIRMDAQLGALWVLKSTQPERVVWQDVIVTTGQATGGEAFSGFTRAKMAMERAVSNNIRRGIEELSQLNLETAASR